MLVADLNGLRPGITQVQVLNRHVAPGIHVHRPLCQFDVGVSARGVGGGIELDGPIGRVIVEIPLGRQKPLGLGQVAAGVAGCAIVEDDIANTIQQVPPVRRHTLLETQGVEIEGIAHRYAARASKIEV